MMMNNHVMIKCYSCAFRSTENHRELLARGALLQFSSLLVSLGGVVAQDKDQGIELVWKLMDFMEGLYFCLYSIFVCFVFVHAFFN